MKKMLPVYSIPHFKQPDPDLYVNKLGSHLKQHQFINDPHRHDFFLVVLFTSGTGVHEVDFEPYPVKSGSLFILRPGQVHNWHLSADSNGWVFFHSRDFYERSAGATTLSDFPFFSPMPATPFIQLHAKDFTKVRSLMEELLDEYNHALTLRDQKIHTLIRLLYIELARCYVPAKQKHNPTYLAQVQKFEGLLEQHFKTLRLPKDYASLMHMSEKHLNRITRATLNKTSTQLIAERVVLEAKRMLFYSGRNVTQIADALGFNDNSYFVRFFKKQVGVSPLSFLKSYKRDRKGK